MDLLFLDGSDMDNALTELQDPVKYRGFLQTMAYFSSYSWRNIYLIYKQIPHATKLADFESWKEQYGRSVVKGSTALKIKAPIERKPIKKTVEKIDPVTGAAVLDEHGKRVMEEITIEQPVQFKNLSLLDISQTNGRPVYCLAGDVVSDDSMFRAFIDVLKIMLPSALTQENEMPSLIEIFAIIKQIAVDRLENSGFDKVDFIADCIAFVVCRRFCVEVDIDLTGLGLEPDAEVLEAIGKQSGGLIADIEDRFLVICKERNIDPMTLHKPVIPTAAQAEPPTATQPEPQTAPQYTKELQTSTVAGVEFKQYTVKPVSANDETEMDITGNLLSEPQEIIKESQSLLIPLPIKQQISNKPTEPPILKHPADPLITIAERNKYGYTRPELLPLTKDRAVALFKRDMTVYLLYSDNTEVMAHYLYDIVKHNGIFGVSYGNWQNSKEYIALASGNPQAIQEAKFIYDGGDSFAVFQTEPDASPVAYKSYEDLQQNEFTIDKRQYSLVYTADLPDSPSDTPAGLFMWVNAELLDDYKGRAMSISDVVSIKKDGVITSHYANGRAFKELLSFIGEEERSKRHKNIIEIKTDINDSADTEQKTTLTQAGEALRTVITAPTAAEESTVTSKIETTEESTVISENSTLTSAQYPPPQSALPVIKPEVPVYRLTAKEAEEYGTTELYETSRRIDFECAETINQTIQTHKKSDIHYDLETPAEFLLFEYGAERLLWVLSCHANVKPNGLTKENIDWVNNTLGGEKNDKAHLFIRSHNAVLDAFINQLRLIFNKKPTFNEVMAKAKKKSDEHNKMNG